MRENKIRAWDQFNAEYIYSDDYEKMSDFWLSVEMRIEGGNHVIIEYCTGLKDNKRTKSFPEGQGIYEGDIVQWHSTENDNPPPWPIEYNDKTAAFYLGPRTIQSVFESGFYQPDRGESSLESIGTIHEKDEIPY